MWQAACSALARSASVQAMTVAAGCSSAISRARFGPDSTATRSAPAPVTSQMTSLIRLVVPSSMPFISDSSDGVAGQQRRPLGEVVPQRLRRHREDDDVGADQRLPGVGGGAHGASGSRMPGR